MTGGLRRFWQDMTSPDFEGVDPECMVAVLPVAAVEQHGPHLPVWVDACLNEGVLEAARAKMGDDMETWPITFLPMQPVGKSNEHIDYPGTLTLSSETLGRVWTEIGACVARAGFRKLVFYNSHGGQPQVMEMVARDLRVRHKMFVVTTSWYSMGLPEGLYDEVERAHGIHAGAVETAMMMHLRPDLVRRDLIANFPSRTVEMADDYKYIKLGGPAKFGWQTQDLNPKGACGDASQATAEDGARIIDFAADRTLELLKEVVRYPLANLKDR